MTTRRLAKLLVRRKRRRKSNLAADFNKKLPKVAVMEGTSVQNRDGIEFRIFFLG